MSGKGDESSSNPVLLSFADVLLCVCCFDVARYTVIDYCEGSLTLVVGFVTTSSCHP